MGARNWKDDGSATSGHKIPFELDPPEKPKRNKFAFLCAIMASMASVLLGYDIGVMSGAAIFIKDDFKISDVKVEILVGIINLYSIIGAAAAGRTSDWVGRRYTMVLAAAFFFVGAIHMGLAPNYAFLMFGRFVAGIGVGYAALIASVYTAEVSPTSSRGCLTSFPEVFVNFGILLRYVSNYAFSKLPIHLGWRFMLGIGLIPSVFLAAVVILIMPESPRWLVMQGRFTSGVVTMTFLSLYRAITIGGVFFLYAGIATVGWVFFYVVFPETRGRNLENVEGLFGNFLWKFSVKKDEEKDAVENSGNKHGQSN
ncbi:putative polyol transporter 1 [Momordica charantia]|uniref:Polyol transporter 1 n=1 Tax=Momordica charantia TaxID=3673 RepID=A0A6J1C2W5_MOMCH|nr:putative polyol transporter 1 [Momordica charantia]